MSETAARELAEAEHTIRSLARLPESVFSYGVKLTRVLAEYDRRGEIEQRAREVAVLDLPARTPGEARKLADLVDALTRAHEAG
jgi:hypothetical protein